MIEEASVIDAVRRGYNELRSSSLEEIISYFAAVDADAALGHMNNIKGILFEEVYTTHLIEQGIEAAMFEATNHPLADIAIYEGSAVVGELQLKATDSASYIAATLQENPDVPLVVTSEVASSFKAGLVTDSGIENAVLEDAVQNTIFEEAISPFGAFTLIRWLMGIPF
ncbi:hypothetical protein [Rubellimicrobium roseum]|uniref:Uncharacterized protein n=1 Tax=Rubellimicrobium roseum TaxID=687525 RepID=A0A5C4NLS1_9RHOB|nr:hypothetical protein [Rubellimicrobium roseum]TNC74338.1 hypothetical protein FHG71_03935 [Rubellimicrobium roseum]